MSSGERESVTIRDLLEEAKKRTVLLVVSAIGLSYLMSLTSKSILINMPVAALLIFTIRYISLDFEMRRRAATYKGKQMSANIFSERKPLECPKVVDRSEWRHKVNSPIVEEAIDIFSRHIISEWVVDLWYSRITPDRQGPEELVLIMNGIIGEISSRVRNINLIDLLLRDVINLVCSELELFRLSNAKIEKQQQSQVLTIEELDIALKSVLIDDNKLHPAIFSAEDEYKFLQHVADGLILVTSKPLDLQCFLYRYISRELLACAILRPALNLANPQFINERIENLVISLNADKTSKNTQSSHSGMQEKNSSDLASWSPDPSVTGVELVPLHKDQHFKDGGFLDSDKKVRTHLHYDPLLSVDACSTPPSGAMKDTDKNREIGIIEQHHSGEEWGDKLDLILLRKTEALAPEHLENMWTRGRNYRRKQYTSQQYDSAQRNVLVRASDSMEKPKLISRHEKESETTGSSLGKKLPRSGKDKTFSDDYDYYDDEDDDDDEESVPSETEYLNGSYMDDEDLSDVTGLDSPGVIVWNGKSRRKTSQIHHPLEISERHKGTKPRKHLHHFKRVRRNKPANKRSRSGEHVWKEVERTSFLSGDRQDILSNSLVNSTSEDSEAELLGRIHSGAKTSSSMSLSSLPEGQSIAADSAKKSIVADSFLRLRCEVVGANIVKSGSKTFAVYSLSVTDVNNNSWSIKRRFRHFEELHRRLKDFPEYNLHLPPKRFLSTGLDVNIIQERCKLLDEYLKKLLQLPTVSCSIEVWDFLSVDSQMYTFSNPLYILETLPALGDRDSMLHQYNEDYVHIIKPVNDFSSSRTEKTEDLKKTFGDSGRDTQIPELKNIFSAVKSDRTVKFERASDSVKSSDHASDPTVPIEWRPPNLSAPILDLVDVVLQLKDGGWIRRKAFWVAKHVLRLGMGDAFDDWIVEKIQLLRKGSVVASGINRLEQILWPDGIFITKHPRRLKPPSSPSQDSPEYTASPEKLEDAQELEDMQQKEAERRAKLVYEIIIDKAPAAVVGLVGRKEYEQCAKDLYYFIQSSVCTKQLAYRLLQLLLLSAFPELGYVFRQLEDERLNST